MDFLAVHWLWMYVGALLMVCEIVTPGFVILFFGIGAVATGLVLAAWPEMPVWVQLAFFSVASVASLLTLRRWFMGALGVKTPTSEMRDIEDGFAGKLATTVQRISPALPGRVVLGDAEWAAVADCVVEPGETVRIVSRDNLTLKVEKLTA
ncbi:MAG: NfeD family protein [Kiritimatiellae bacterium]|nr:NfeD family protein [Kiritimatiellia bacterium]